MFKQTEVIEVDDPIYQSRNLILCLNSTFAYNKPKSRF